MKKLIIGLLSMTGLYALARDAKEWLTARNPGNIRHKREMENFYSQFVKKGDLCFDIGANLGNRVEIFLKLGARVVAVEPQEFCVKKLGHKFKNNQDVVMVRKALGEKTCEAKLMVSNAHTLSSLSEEWVEKVKTSGRFASYKWDKTETVQVTTLDQLIEEYGDPAFCKIDVEGFEYKVLKGLSRPIKAVSFEFTSELVDVAIDSVKHISGLGTAEFNYSTGESMELSLSEWIGPDKICDILREIGRKSTFGDVYAKFIK